jgi:hypothetical protein
MTRFPKDGFADTCTGYGRPEHGADVVTDEALCADCSLALTVSCAARRDAARVTQGCPGGCRDHAHGSRYYDCNCCYGD